MTISIPLDNVAKYKDGFAIIDYKTSSNYYRSNREKYFTQMGGYSLVVPVQYLIIIPCSPKKYVEPIITADVAGYQEKFLKLREQYLFDFGI